MDKNWLKRQLMRLYIDYGVDETELKIFTENQIANRTKGYLAILDREKKNEYSKEDVDIIKKIYYYFG